MSQAVITKAFSEWKALQAIDNQPITLDEFIFAYIPDLDVTKPIDETEGLPSADKIVHRQAVSKTGVVNENSVVYSVTLGADVGDFNFNWIGLVNKANSTLAMIIHAPTQSKIKNASGKQGNVLVRSMLMEYSGAAAETEITTPAETWQIDFTARLSGIDEAVRLAALDIYGSGAFFADGFLVAKTGAQYFVTKGLGYVSGLRAVLQANQNISVSDKPVKVWIDICYQGTLTSAYETIIKFTLASDLNNYQVNGIKHYVFALASIDAGGVITDLRPKGSLGEQQSRNDYLRKDNDLSDVNDATKARKNLGLKGAAILDVGQGSGKVAAGDDPRITDALQGKENLSDLKDPVEARKNLGLKGAAILDVGQDVGKVAAGDDPRITGALQSEANLLDLKSIPEAVKNLGLSNIVLAGIATGYLYETGMFEIPLIIAGKREKVIVQWGTANNNASATTTTNFITPFPKQCFVVIPVGYQVAGNIQAYVTLNSRNKNYFTWNAFYGQGGYAPVSAPRVGDVTCFYIAIGI